MHKKTHPWLWLLAFVLTLLLAVYQRLSGPTYPLRGSQEFAGAEIRYRLPRSGTSHEPLTVRIAARAAGLRLRLYHRRFPLIAGEPWAVEPMSEKQGFFECRIPGQPAAGKVTYKIEVIAPGGPSWLNGGRPVVARFKNEVPSWLLISHVLLMFAGMLLAFRAGLGALLREGNWPRLTAWTLGVTVVGGLIFGPIVQKFAFGAYWTGFPLGGDLTDSKTLFVALFWLAAHLLRKKGRWWTVAATVLMVAVYLIPHSMLGSELNYQTGKIETAKEVRGSTPKIK
ncbi:MAG: hypothetical protein MUP71_08905 [Candidatus Aminicenantes bacterium]|jgi:hypothetical protein|nr:hypothetical protein [Candidatus Aminicenantes bacterium]